MAPPLRRVSIQGYRAARELEFAPGSVCALVGEASSGKSTVLTAIWTLLEAAAPPPTIDDVARDGARRAASTSRRTSRKGTIFLDARPPDTLNLNRAGAPPVLFLPANLRSRTLVAPATGRGRCRGRRALPAAARRSSLGRGRRRARARRGHGAARSRSNLRHFVLLIEEPELYLSPHAQRHLYGLLRDARAGGQPDPLLDARAGLPQRRPARGARARPSHADRRDVALPAGAARRGRDVPRALGVRQRPRRALPRALRACSSRGAPRS